jgi:outer membrane protein OmpU
MKKILLATAAVALTAGAASADISMNGYARAGVAYSNNKSTTGTSTATLTDRFRLFIKVNKKTDSGLNVGAFTRMQSNAGDGALTTSSAQIYVEQNGLKLEMGNIDGPIEQMPGLYSPSTGLTGLGYGGLVTNYYDLGGTYHSFDWLGNYQGGTPGTYGNATGVQVNYTMGGLTAMVASGGLNATSGNNSTQAMVAYNFGNITAAAAYSGGSYDGSNSRRALATVSGKVGPVDLTLGYGSNTPIAAGVKGKNIGKYSLNAAYTMGQISMNAYYAHQNNLPVGRSNAYGVGASYDLGGASLKGGVAKAPSGDTIADFGVFFSF